MTENKVVFLIKANDDLISHCKCEGIPIGAPAQMDCPWCGCGWLFICPNCRRAFTFAWAVEVELGWEQLAHNDLDGKYGNVPTDQDIAEWIEFMKILLKHIEVGQQYVYIDGWVLPAHQKELRFDGWHSRHELEMAPQTAALTDSSLLDATLGNERYWRENEISE